MSESETIELHQLTYDRLPKGAKRTENGVRLVAITAWNKDKSVWEKQWKRVVFKKG